MPTVGNLTDDNGDGILDDQDLCVGDDLSGDEDADGHCALGVEGQTWDCGHGRPGYSKTRVHSLKKIVAIAVEHVPQIALAALPTGALTSNA